MELTDFVKKLKEENDDLMIEVEWSHNDGYFKYYISKWDEWSNRYRPIWAFHSYADLKSFMENR
jgi:hypothetical protein